VPEDLKSKVTFFLNNLTKETIEDRAEKFGYFNEIKN